MVTITLHCLHCQSDALVRNGYAPHGKQLYHCRAYGRQSRETPTPNASPEARREEILHVYQERSSLRGLTRTCGVSRTTVSTWIKKSSSASLLEHDIGSPRSGRCASTTLELDELWSFVLNKAKEVWVWSALCRKTRQVVAYA